MSEISKAIQEDSDSQKFAVCTLCTGRNIESAHISQSTASAYMNTWKSLALSSNQQNILFAYDNTGSWGLIYNLYADKLLNLNLVPSEVKRMS